MESNRTGVCIVVLAISAVALCSYPEYVVEDQCRRGNETIIYNVSGPVGILRATARPPYETNKDCKIIIQPSEGRGIVISIQKIDFRQPSYFCMDYLKVYRSDASPATLCSFKFDLKERLSYYFRRRAELVYHTESRRSDGLDIEEGFELTFTVASEDLQDCLKSDMFLCNNGRCIPDSLTCDFKNNCGDRSDETHLLCDTSADHYFRVTNVLYGSLISLLILLLVLGGAVLMYRRVRRVSSSDEPSVSPYQAVHPCGYFICRDPAGPTHLLKGDGGFSNPCYPTASRDPPPPYTASGN